MSKIHRRPPRPDAAPAQEAAPPEFRTVNEVVAHNLARARHAKGWTQGEAAKRLQQQSGKTWTAATLGAAERTAAGTSVSRTRQFDANELLAFSLVFGQPISYFFLPPDIDGKDVVVFMNNQVENYSSPPFGVAEVDLLESAIPLRFSAEVVDGVNRILRKRGQVWSPGRADLDWYRPEEQEEYPPAPNNEEESRFERKQAYRFEYQQEVSRRAEAKLSSEEFGALLRVHSSEVAKLLADEMANRGLWQKRQTARTDEADDGGSQAYTDEPPF